jgi:spore coat polysaccharide biosynthesis protein SpsF
MPEPTIGIILQARVASTRLPGKVMKNLAGKPMIEWIIRRLSLSKRSGILVLAIPETPSDDPLARLGSQLNIRVFRGSQTDVLDRYYQCAKHFHLDVVVRATGDNPFVDPHECDRLIDLYSFAKVDYASSFKGGLPVGVGLEVFGFPALEASWKEGTLPRHREHVNEFIHDHPERFTSALLKADPAKTAPDLSLTVDTQEQFDNAAKLYESYLKEHPGSYVPVEWVIAQ